MYLFLCVLLSQTDVVTDIRIKEKHILMDDRYPPVDLLLVHLFHRNSVYVYLSLKIP